MTGSQWIQSGGGPLILLPLEVLPVWGGVRTTDYARACASEDAVALIGVAGGVGLVLGDEPHQTSWLGDPAGGWLVRWVYADRESEVWAAVESVDAGAFASSKELIFKTGDSGRCVLLDSAEPGLSIQGPRFAVLLLAGSYSVRTAELVPSETTRVVVHRLTRV